MQPRTGVSDLRSTIPRDAEAQPAVALGEASAAGADDVEFQPAISLPAPARMLVKSADAVPQSMLLLDTVYPPAGRYAEPARSLCNTVKPMPAHRMSFVDPPVDEPAATTRERIEPTCVLPKRR